MSRMIFAICVAVLCNWAESQFCWRLSMVEHNAWHKFLVTFGSSEDKLLFAMMEPSTAEDTMISLREPSLFKGEDLSIDLRRAKSVE